MAGPYVDELASVLGDASGEADFLRGSFPRQHAILAALDAGDGAAADPSEIAVMTAHLLRSSPRELVCAAYGVCPPGLLGLFSRLGPARPERRGVYRALVRMLCEEGTGAKTLRHASRPTFEAIALLAALPDWARIRAALSADAVTLSGLVALGDVFLMRGLASLHEVQALVAGSSPLASIVTTLARQGYDLDLPAPPHPGTDRLRPLRTAQQLLRIAELFVNCLDMRVPQAMSGEHAYYVWLGMEPAVVELERVEGLWWSLSQATGYQNRELTSGTFTEIRRELRLEELSHAALNALMIRRGSEAGAS